MRSLRQALKAFGLVLCTLICAIFVMFFPMQTTYATIDDDDFDKFHASLMNMITNFDDESTALEEDEYRVEDGQVYVSEKAIEKYGLIVSNSNTRIVSNLQTAQNKNEEMTKEGEQNFCAVDLQKKDGKVVVETQTNRLIVNSASKVESFGAVAVAEFKDWHIFQYNSHSQAQFAYEQLSNSNINVSFDFVVSANEPIEEEVETVPNATSSHNSWADEYVGYDEFANNTLIMYDKQTLPEIVVAVIDSGIYANHEMFQGRILTKYAKNFSNDDENIVQYSYQDLNGHGTHVSGTIVEFTMPNVKILPLKALNHEGKGYGSMIVAALNYVVELKGQGVNIKVANMSLGIDLAKSELLTGYTDLTLAVEAAKNVGIACVVSAGNESRDTRYSSPASIDEAFTISALQLVSNRVGGYKLEFDASYSNFGSHVDFSAPGTHIKSASILAPTAYAYMSGTSMAAPHVSAAVALLISNPFYQNFSIDEIYDLLKTNSVDLGVQNRDDLYGFGCINIANIGYEQSGEVQFSTTEKMHTQKFSVSLDYVQKENVEIYYTFGNAESVDASNGKLYQEPIEISKTTKLTAMGYLKDYEHKKLQKSFSTSITYYFDNMDLLENYDFSLVGSGYVISNYHGTDLTTLNVPKTYNNRSVVGVGAYAFANSNVQVLNLPQSLRYFDNSAFSENTILKEIHCNSSSVDVRTYAFYRCTNLQNFDVPNTSSVGSYAFAYCSNLKTLNLLYAKEIGYNAISGSGVEDFYVAKGTSIAEQSELSLDFVHGFASANGNSDAEQLAEKYGGEFFDLTLKINADLNSTIIVREGEAANFGLNFTGVGVKVTSTLNGQNSTERNVSTQIFGDDFEKWAMFKVSGLSNSNNTFQVRLEDEFGNVVQSRELKIDVVTDDRGTFALTTTGENFDLNVVDENGQNVTSSQNFYKKSRYVVGVRPQDGYVLESVIAKENGINFEITKFSSNFAKIELSNIGGDIEIDVSTSQKPNLDVVFDIQTGGKVFVDNQVVENSVNIKRGGSLKFRVETQKGYELRRVLLNGQKLEEISPNEYEISNIEKDMTVTILFFEVMHKVTISRGKGGNISTNGGIEDDISFDEAREYHITASEGYSIDTVTVNGNPVEVKNGSFVIKEQTEDCNIVVSFKKNEKSIFASNSIGLLYFFIFLSILFVFILAKIILSAVRKNQKRKKNLNSH